MLVMLHEQPCSRSVLSSWICVRAEVELAYRIIADCVLSDGRSTFLSSVEQDNYFEESPISCFDSQSDPAFNSTTVHYNGYPFSGSTTCQLASQVV